MLQRTLLRASRSSLQNPSLAARQPSSQIIRSTRFNTPSYTPLASSRRTYADSATAEKTPEEASKTEAGTGTVGAAASSSAKDPSAPSSTSSPDTTKLKADLEARTKEVADYKDRYVRMVADYRTLQDRTKREVQAAKDFALQKLSKDLLGSLDNLDHAIRSVPAEKLSSAPPSASQDSSVEVIVETLHKDLKALHGGLTMTERILVETLGKHGLMRVDPAEGGDKFDPNLHEAVFMAPQPDKEDGAVFYTEQKGWSLNGRVVRAPKVGVVRNS